MLEKQVWKYIREAERGRAGVRWMRCENIVANGVPDINGCIGGREFWLEVKSPRVHLRDSTPVFGGSHKISPQQFAFFRAQAAAGGKAFVLIANEKLTALLDGGKVDPGVHAASLSVLKDHPAMLAYLEQPISQCWGIIRMVLVETINE